MIYDNKFNVLSLQDNGKQSLSFDPVTVVTGGYNIIQEILGLFGGDPNRRLTLQDWQKLFPTNGYWNNRLRDYLSSTILYDNQLENISLYTQYFVHENMQELSGGQYPNLDQNMPPGEFTRILNEFYKKLENERTGTTNGFLTSSFVGSGSLVPVVGGVILLGLIFAGSKKNGR